MVFFVVVVSFFQGKRKRKPPSAKSCLCMRRAFLGQGVQRPRRLESKCLLASHQPSSQEGVRTSLSLAKVLWLTSKLSVMEGRGGRRESQTLGKVGGERLWGGGTRRTNRAMLLSQQLVSERHRHTWNGRRQPGHRDQRLRSITTRCGFSPRRGTSLLRAS